MTNIVRKALLFGLGVYQISRDKIEVFVAELEKEGQITPEEGKKLVEESMRKLDVERVKFSKEMEKVIQKVLKEIHSETAKATDTKTAGRKTAPKAKSKTAKKSTTSKSTTTKKAKK